MKKILLIVFTMISLLLFGKEVRKEDLEERSGVMYEIATGKPYTGTSLIYDGEFLNTRSEYKNGLLDGKTTIYNYNNNISIETTMRKGQQNGSTKVYYDSGKLRASGTFKNGKIEGVSKEYHENGRVMTEGRYKNGHEHGLFQEYDENGNLINKINYENGKIINK
ncbi:MAG: toxin-antitoxin system YwqK family antitoxin [Fusobacteriaceae bacterium]|jgi:antitoxin component YwqK of YwqJK toxin-antitoxin module|nr:toxin-antitoxin system YwqK family antitoxin [Fusobacteriaceae bacterium]